MHGLEAPGIYVSIPFCAQKCTYCNFRSAVYSRSLRTDYLRCLGDELAESELPGAGTLYLGGGSPSLLEPEEFAALAARLPRPDTGEATIEVAPGEASEARIAAWTAAGFGRASLGVQSFDPAVARAAGRRHDPEVVRTEVRLLAEAGIREISVDLIAGLAHQTESTWRRSLEWVQRIGAGHVSVYMLESDDGSRLGREIQAGGRKYGASHVPADDAVADFYLLAVERLRSMGYERYEVSNFARPGKRSQHNLKYWRMEPYVGFGSDAHSFDGLRRWSNVGDAPEYVRRVLAGRGPRARCEELDAARLLEDRVLTGLRTTEGVRLSQSEWQELLPRAESLVARHWLVLDQPSIRLTDSGLLFADEAIAELLL